MGNTVRGLLCAAVLATVLCFCCTHAFGVSAFGDLDMGSPPDLLELEQDVLAFQDSVASAFRQEVPLGDAAGAPLPIAEMTALPFSGNLTFIEPNADYFNPNRTVFVAAGGEGSSASTCGDVYNPCSSMALAFTLAGSIVLMPGTHYVSETLCLRYRPVAIAGLLGSNETRPRIAAAEDTDFGQSPGLLFFLLCPSVILDTIEVSSWRCEAYCMEAAVSAFDTSSMTVRNCRMADNVKHDTITNSNSVPQFFPSALSFISETLRGLLSVQDSHFEGNEVHLETIAGTRVFGAALMAYGGSLEVLDSHFMHNTVRVDAAVAQQTPVRGGAVSVNYCDTTIRGTTFGYNGIIPTAGKVISIGGALSAYRSNVVVDNCNWFRNAASGVEGGNVIGGAMAVEYGPVSLSDSTFSANIAVASYDSGSYTAGGAVGIFSDSLIVTNCTFSDNSVYPRSNDVFGGFGYGGAVWIFWTARGVISLSDSRFVGNSVFGRANVRPAFVGSGAYGGAVSVSSASAVEIDVARCAFLNNSVRAGPSSEGLGGSAGGGAFATQTDSSASMTISNSLFVDNKAIGGTGMFGSSFSGGGALLTGVPTTVVYCDFTGNTVVGGDIIRVTGSHRGGTGGGGAIVGFNSLQLSSSRFTLNTALGGLPLKQEYLYSGYSCGGALLHTHEFAVEDCLFEGNGLSFTNFTKSTSLAGGAIVSLAGASTREISITRTVFSGNFITTRKQIRGSKVIGGAVMVIGSKAIATISDSVFQDNRIEVDHSGSACGSFGGALYVSVGGALSNLTFTGNAIGSRYPSYGGAFALPFQMEISLANLTFQANGVGSGREPGLGAGGGMYVYYQGVNATNLVFEDNYADYGGGVMYWLLPGEYAEASADGMYFTNNTAVVSGGGIYYLESNWPATLSCPVEGLGNTAGYGDQCGSNVFDVVFRDNVPAYIWPGQTISIAIIIIDAFSNTAIIPGYSMTAFATAPIDTGAAKDTVLPTEQGFYFFPRTRIFAEPLSLVDVRFSVEALDALLEEELELPSINATFTVFPCPADHYASSSTVCAPCEQANYNFDGISCQPCPENGVQCIDIASNNGLALKILEGYYPSSFLNPTTLTLCPNRDSCPGYDCQTYADEQSLTWTLDCSTCPSSTASDNDGLDCMCSAGYTGRLCSECLFTEDVCFFRSGDECLDSSSLPLGLWGPFLELIVYCAVTVFWLSLRQDAERGSAKTLVFYVQTMAALCDKAFAPFGVLNLLASVTSGVVLTWLNVASLRCLSYEIFSKEVVEVAVLALMPLLLFWPCTVLVHFASGAFHHWKAQRAMKKMDFSLNADDVSRALLSQSPSSPRGSPCESPLASSGGSSPSSNGSPRSSSQEEFDWKDHVMDASFHSLLYVLHSSFFNVCNLLFASWGCVKDTGTDQWYSIQMPWMQCSAESGWLSLLAVTMALSLLLVVGPLALFTALLYRHRHELSDPAVFRRMGFLYGSYRDEVYWWEMAALGRRLLLSLTLALFAQESPLYSSGAVAILCASAALQFHFTPFTTHRENLLEVVCLVVIVASFQASQFLSTLSSLDTFALWVTQIAVLLVNGLIILYLSIVVGTEVFLEVKPKAATYFEKIRSSANLAGLQTIARKAYPRRRSPSIQSGL